MRSWGLKAHLYDLHEVVKRARAAADTVILGGHSLGASLVSLYAAHVFGDKLGDDFIDGLLLMDGTLGRTGAFGIARGLFLGDLELIPGGEGYDAGRGYAFVPFGATPETQVDIISRALLARFEPEALAPDARFPITNLAFFGAREDREYALSGIFAASLGEAVGARYGGNLPAFVLDGWQSRTSRSVAGVAEGADKVTWSAGDPEREHTDPHDYVSTFVTPYTDYYEWYFPLRLLVDMSELPLDLEGYEAFAPHREVKAPTLAIGARRGLVTSLDGFASYSNLRASALFSSYTLPDFSHLDVVAARDNPVVPLFNRWFAQVQQLAVTQRQKP